MPPHDPAYRLWDFVGACSEGSSVVVLRSAMATAPTDFGLMTEQDVIEWIGNGGLEKPEHANTGPFWGEKPLNRARP